MIRIWCYDHAQGAPMETVGNNTHDIIYQNADNSILVFIKSYQVRIVF